MEERKLRKLIREEVRRLVEQDAQNAVESSFESGRSQVSSDRQDEVMCIELRALDQLDDNLKDTFLRLARDVEEMMDNDYARDIRTLLKKLQGW